MAKAAAARPMKLIIQIPCFNEENVLPATLGDLPRELEGFDTVEWLIIDEHRRTVGGSGVRDDHVVRFNTNKGLAVAFQAGIDAALKLGADVVVNTDADNQYQADDIPKLVQPILAHEADIVVGARNLKDHEEFSGSRSFCSAGARGRAAGVPDRHPGRHVRLPGLQPRSRPAPQRRLALHLHHRHHHSGGEERPGSHARSHPHQSEDAGVTAFPLEQAVRRALDRDDPAHLGDVRPAAGSCSRRRWSASSGRCSWGASPGSTSASRARQATYQSLIVGAALFIFAVQLVLLGVISDLLRSNRIIRAHPAPRAQDRARRGRPARRGSQEALVGSGLSYGDDEA